MYYIIKSAILAQPNRHEAHAASIRHSTTMSAFPDYYGLLNLPKGASQEEIRQAYKKASLRSQKTLSQVQKSVHSSLQDTSGSARERYRSAKEEGNRGVPGGGGCLLCSV